MLLRLFSSSKLSPDVSYITITSVQTVLHTVRLQSRFNIVVDVSAVQWRNFPTRKRQIKCRPDSQTDIDTNHDSKSLHCVLFHKQLHSVYAINLCRDNKPNKIGFMMITLVL